MTGLTKDDIQRLLENRLIEREREELQHKMEQDDFIKVIKGWKQKAIDLEMEKRNKKLKKLLDSI